MSAQEDPKTYTLLVIDDEPDILDAIQRLFRKEYRVLTAQSIAQAHEILAQETIEVILADQRLPRSSGIEFFTEIHKSHPDITRVLFTGYTNIDDVIDSINKGHIYRYISKPWRPAELKLFIEQAFEYHRAKKERKHLLEALQQANQKLEAQNTHLEDANEKLKTLDRVRRVFMEVISHELNTPIAIITGYTHLLVRELEHSPSPIATKSLDRIESSSKRLRRISDRIFQMISEDDPANTLYLTSIDLRQFAVSLHEHVAPFLQKRNQKLLSDIQVDLPEIQADPDKLLDIFVHLTMNAIKFSQDGNNIYFSAALHPERNDHIVLSIRDQGIGIDSEDLDQIFQAFFSSFKTDHHSSGVFEFGKRGIGLGLSIAKKFTTMHGGTIEVESNEGTGSTFTVIIPITPPTS